VVLTTTAHPPVGRGIVALLAGGLVLDAIAGCTQQPPRQQEPAAVHLDVATVDMVTNSGGFPESSHDIDVVDAELTRRCMKAAGFTWWRTAVAARTRAAIDADYLARIRRQGYGLSEEPEPPPKAGPVADRSRERDALLGPPDDLATLRTPAGGVFSYPRHGCQARSRLMIFGDLDSWARATRYPQEFNRQIARASEADPRYLAKQKEWRACMAGKGYSYRTPDDIAGRLTEAYRTDSRPLAERRAAEIKIALDDFGCVKSARLAETSLQLRREYAQKLPAADRAELARLAGVFSDATKRAEKLRGELQ
jgi:hypothetical protein